MCSQKECPTKFETRWHQEIPFSKEVTDNYCALGLLFESKTCNNIIINDQGFCNLSRNLAFFWKDAGHEWGIIHYNLDTFFIIAYFVVIKSVTSLKNVAGFGRRTLRSSLALPVVGAIERAGLRKEVGLLRPGPRGPKVLRRQMVRWCARGTEYRI